MKIHRITLTREGLRHLLMLALVFSGGLGLVAWGWPLDFEAWVSLRQEVVRLQSEQPTPPDKPKRGADAAASKSDDALLPDEPALTEADTVWPWLQARMQAQGLQVQTLRPQTVTTKDGLPQQAVTLQLQGRWHDWLALEAALNVHAPWWVIDQWLVAPVVAVPDAVRIELQARMGLRPTALPVSNTPRVWPRWSEAAALMPAASNALFASAPSNAPVASDREAAGVSSSTGAGESPLDGWRLLGVWRQASVRHAVIGMGNDSVVLGVGQRIGRGTYRVQKIGDDHVELMSTDKRGLALRLVMQESKP